MQRSFENIHIGLMVGIGGGAPSKKHDIRLSDVVVSTPGHQSGGVVHYEFGKAIQDQKFQRTGSLPPPPKFLLSALQGLHASHDRKGLQITEIINTMIMKNWRLRNKYQKPDFLHDVLYKSSFTHQNDDQACSDFCIQNTEQIVQRPKRDPDDGGPVVHYGLIASADRLMKNALVRDQLAKEEDVLCFEMEAAGLMDEFTFLVIRGICDYSDTHKNDVWQGYAAATAAAYAKDLLGIIPRNIEPQEGPYSAKGSPELYGEPWT
jgi:nucleoside phosphorylase